MKPLTIIFLGVVGYGYVIYSLGWKVALAIYLINWAINIEHEKE